MHYFQFEIKEWISNTAHLTLEEEAAYLRLINYYYDSEKPIPNDIALISRKLRISNIEVTKGILHEFFQESDEGFIHNRCDVEITKYRAKSEQASRAGKASAVARASASLTPVQRPLNQSLIINQESLIINKEPKKNLPIPEGMNIVVWSDYLKLRNKQKKPLTETALKGLQREADKAKLPLVDVLEICCERGWIGFKSEWLDSKQTTKTGGQEWRNNDSLMIAKATELGLSTIGMQRYDIINKIDSHLRSRGL
jgi:uncharacterized protein YdaU (DUF1376 family)